VTLNSRQSPKVALLNRSWCRLWNDLAPRASSPLALDGPYVFRVVGHGKWVVHIRGGVIRFVPTPAPREVDVFFTTIEELRSWLAGPLGDPEEVPVFLRVGSADRREIAAFTAPLAVDLRPPTRRVEPEDWDAFDMIEDFVPIPIPRTPEQMAALETLERYFAERGYSLETSSDRGITWQPAELGDL
jgi:hypothetical protein